MRACFRIFNVALVVFVSSLLVAIPDCFADDGHPVAIRHWPDGGFTLETMWGLSVGMGISDDARKKLPDSPAAEMEKLMLNQTMRLSRSPNVSSLELSATNENLQMRVAQAAGKSDPKRKNVVFLARQKASTDGGEVLVSTVSVDNVFVVNFNEMDPTEITNYLSLIGPQMKVVYDAIGVRNNHYFVIANRDDLDVKTYQQITNALHPEILFVRSGLEAVGDKKVEIVAHNTAAISSSSKRGDETRYVALGTKSYEMSVELTDLFARKEASCKGACEIFSELSVEQMNFKPANGTHTPRWNTEHMMGRELGFFSSIYHAIDPSIPVMNLNPRQMPKDYKFAHEDWSGAEEALQMQRVQAFTRRFAYLLDGADLKKRIKGNPFPSLRALLKQMERHYNEHTANVVKKMELDGWPEN